MEQQNVVAANASDFKEEANDAVQILEFLRAVHMGQDLPPDVRILLEDLFFRHMMRTKARMKKDGLRDERLFKKLLEKSKIEFAPSITLLNDALTKSCGKASKNEKETADAATDTEDLTSTSASTNQNVMGGSTAGDGGGEDDDGTGTTDGGSDLDDSDEDGDGDGDAPFSNGNSDIIALPRRSRRKRQQRPAPQASPPGNEKAKPKPARKKKGTKKKRVPKTAAKTTNAVPGAAAAGADDNDEGSTTALTDRDFIERLAQLEWSLTDGQIIQETINGLQQKLDDYEDDPSALPQYVAEKIPIIKVLVETLQMFARGNVTVVQLKKSIADSVTLIEPYQELVEQLLVASNETIKDLSIEKKFDIRNKTLGAALASTKDDTAKADKGEADQMNEQERARAIIKNAQDATGISCKTSLLECLRLKSTLRNAIRFILNFRVAIDVLEGGELSHFLPKKDQTKAIKLAKEEGNLDCATKSCNTMNFISTVIFPCSEGRSATKVELVLALVKGMKKVRDSKVKALYDQAATLNIATGEHEGTSDYFDTKEGKGSIDLPSMTFMVIALGDDVDKQLENLGLVPTSLNFSSSLFGTSIRAMEKTVGFVAKPKFWNGNFDAVRGKFDAHKLTQDDVVGKLEDICERAEEKMTDHEGKYMLLQVSNIFLEAIVRFRDMICANRQTEQ